MNSVEYRLEIDRIVLEGLDLSPGEAERLRGAIEAALGRTLAGEEGLQGPAGGDIARLDAGVIRLDGSNSALADGAARRIAGALRAPP
jgi:hypothetical protein